MCGQVIARLWKFSVDSNRKRLAWGQESPGRWEPSPPAPSSSIWWRPRYSLLHTTLFIMSARFSQNLQLLPCLQHRPIGTFPGSLWATYLRQNWIHPTQLYQILRPALLEPSAPRLRKGSNIHTPTGSYHTLYKLVYNLTERRLGMITRCFDNAKETLQVLWLRDSTLIYLGTWI